MLSRAPRLVLIGIPWDGSSSFLRGAAAAPGPIRQALWSPSTNTSSELGIAIDPESIDDAGDILLGSDEGEARSAIEAALGRIVEEHAVPIGLGGDHSSTGSIPPSPLGYRIPGRAGCQCAMSCACCTR